MRNLGTILQCLLLFTCYLIGSPLFAQELAKDADKTTGHFDALKYRSIGPAAGGRVSRACGLPGDPLTYYLAAASGGVWKTTDAGLNWESIFDDQPTSSWGAIAVADSDPNVIYVGSGEANIRGNVITGDGIFRSTDAGKSWQHVWKQRGQVGKIIIHPHNADIAYAAVLGQVFSPNPERGVYRTEDGGTTWKQVLTKKFTVKNGDETIKDYAGAIDICFDPANPRILFAALWQVRRTPWSLVTGGPGSGIYTSTDAGDTWKLLGPKHTRKTGDEKAKDAGAGDKSIVGDTGNGLPEGPYGRVGLAVAPSDSQRIYALIEADKGGLYRSDDGGGKWSLINDAAYLRTRPWYFSTIHVDPANADVIWAANIHLLKSIDGGKSFQKLKQPHHLDHHDLWIDPHNPKRMINSNDGGVDITNNSGQSWFAPRLPICQFYHINVDKRVPYHVSGTMQDLGTASGPSNSLSSDGIQLADWHHVGGGETGFTAPDPDNPNIVYAGEYSGYLSRYDHRTRQAHPIGIYPITPSGKGAGDIRYRFQWTAPLLVSPHDGKVVYHGANVLFKTADAGKTWQKISPDLTRDDKSKQQWTGGPITGDNTGVEYYCTIFAIAESPAQSGVLWTGSDDGLVHVSRDAGKNWINVTANIPGLPEWGTVACIEPSHTDPAAAFVVVDNHRLDDHRPYLWSTRDFGKTWQNLAAALPDDEYLMVVRQDPVNTSVLYAGSLRGVWMSADTGKNWQKLRLNMPTVAVSDLRVKGNDLVVGTNGRSVWILDDVTPLRHGKLGKNAGGKNALGKDAILFPTQPAIRWRYHATLRSDRNPGANPPEGAIINYYLPRKPKNDLKLEILDEHGKVIRTFTSKKDEEAADKDHPEPLPRLKRAVLPAAPGVQRFAWNLTHEGPRFIPGARSDFGIPDAGPLVPPGIYGARCTVDGVSAVRHFKVMPDPRVQLPAGDISQLVDFCLQVRGDINKLTDTAIALRSLRKQLESRSKEWKKVAGTEVLRNNAHKLIVDLDALEVELHNPRARATYDILAHKGGARLYSQLNLLFDLTRGSDGPVTQGMREVYAEHQKELAALLRQWSTLRTRASELNRLAAKVPQIIVPE